MSFRFFMNPTRSHQIALIDAADFWQGSRSNALIDVRSPAEFAQGHIPGAVNLPLFDNQQRAEIGTIYKNSGSQDAMLRGLHLVGPKMGELSSAARELATQNGGEIFVHCWRGGLRSESMAWLLKISGLKPWVLDGGYKAFRNHAHCLFEKKWPFVVVSGWTGSGKTEVLDELSGLGQQVVDLERLAHHRGSAFGSIGQPDQPTTEQFENLLFEKLSQCDPAKTIWIEDEGNRLGTVVVPPPIVHQIRESNAISIVSNSETRVNRLMEEYGGFAGERLIESIASIRKRLGPQHADEATHSIRSGNIRRAIEIVLDYYDRTYQHAAEQMPRQSNQMIPSDGLSARAIAERMIEIQDVGYPRG